MGRRNKQANKASHQPPPEPRSNDDEEDSDDEEIPEDEGKLEWHWPS